MPIVRFVKNFEYNTIVIVARKVVCDLFPNFTKFIIFFFVAANATAPPVLLLFAQL